MNIRLDQLNRWRAFAELARSTAVSARLCYARGEVQQGRELLADLETQGAAVGVAMEQAGADRPSSLPPPPDVPLQLLDTPANLRYLTALQEAHLAALAVDRERYGSQDGPAAHAVAELVAVVEMEVYGPQGLGHE